MPEATISTETFVRVLALSALLAGRVLAAAPDAATVRTPWGVVAEPTLPATACATLAATLSPVNGSIDAADENPARSAPDTLRLQHAIDACTAGQAVHLVSGERGESGFLSGPLTLKSGVTLWIDAGVTLFASRNPADYDNGSGACGTAVRVELRACRPFILARGTQRSGIVGDGVIDARGGSVLTGGANAGRRSWWDVAWQNKSEGLKQQNPQLLRIEEGGEFTLYRIALLNSPQFHVVASHVTGLTAWGLRILTPSAVYSVPGYDCPRGSTPDARTPATCFTPDTAKNTDGFDPGESTRVLLAHAWISTGDDHVAVKSHGRFSSHDLAFVDNEFHYGHGLSIGSETDSGASRVWVDGLTMDGHDSPNGIGLRIKSDASRGGEVRDVQYRRICLRNVRQPLVFDSFYSAAPSRALYPHFHDIVIRDLHDVSDGAHAPRQLTFAGFHANGQDLPLGITLDNVVFDGVQPGFAKGHNGGPSRFPSAARFTLGPGPVSFAESLRAAAGGDVTVTGTPTPSAPLDCSAAFAGMRDIQQIGTN